MTAAATPPPPDEDAAAFRSTRRGFLLAWAVFWLLMLAQELQDAWPRPGIRWWQPLLWQASSFVVASAFAAGWWRQVRRLDDRLARPAHWLAAVLWRLPLAAPLFVALNYGLRHAGYALAGATYVHPPWPQVFVVEGLKFTVFFLLFAALVFGMRSHAAWAVARVQAERARGLEREARLLQLTQQLEPHFLFNALNTIAGTVHEDPDRADALITALAGLLRAATDLARRPLVPLAEEWQLLQAYADIMQARHAGRLQVDFSLDPALAGRPVPALLLQPLLENALVHGVERCPGAARVQVFARAEGSRLQLGLRCDQGRVDATAEPGVGLGTLRARLAALYGPRASLALQALPERGSLALVELPL